MDGNEDDETQSGRDVKLCNDVTAPESKFRIDSSSLPNGAETEMDFVESSFFKSNAPNPRLPTPAEVRALSPGYDKKSQPLPVRFEHLGLIVKFGRMIAVAEAQSLWVIKRVFGEKVPVPEVYGWRVDDGRVYIYMQLIRGPTLKERWDTLSVSDKAVICDDLRQMITSLRRAEQDPHDIFIGSIDRQNLLDYVFQCEPPGGPFTSTKLFHDWFSWLPFRWVPETTKFDDPWRSFLPDTAAITLTHGDLHRSNIIVSPTGSPPRVLAIIDWGHAGWYPDYWEYCKACYTAVYGDEWREEWIPRFLSPRPDEFYAFGEYTMAMGAV